MDSLCEKCENGVARNNICPFGLVFLNDEHRCGCCDDCRQSCVDDVRNFSDEEIEEHIQNVVRLKEIIQEQTT